jgi:hypothetical protein
MNVSAISSLPLRAIILPAKKSGGGFGLTVAIGSSDRAAHPVVLKGRLKFQDRVA